VIVVLLPTVCLLWFIARTVNNERLAMEQRLVNIYQEKIADSRKLNDRLLDEKLSRIRPLASGEPADFLAAVSNSGFDATVIYDAKGTALYPRISVSDSNVSQRELMSEAWEMEFIRLSYPKAIKLYERHIDSKAPEIRFAAIMAKARCLLKMGQVEQAVATANAIRLESTFPEDSAAIDLYARSRLFVMDLSGKLETDSQRVYNSAFSDLLTFVQSQMNESLLTAPQKTFFAQKLLDIYHDSDVLKKKFPDLDTATIQEMVNREELSLRVAEWYSLPADLAGSLDTFQHITLDEQVYYVMLRRVNDMSLLLVVGPENIQALVEGIQETFEGSDVSYMITDEMQSFVAGTEILQQAPLAEDLIGDRFAGWNIYLYPVSEDIFSRNAARQTTLYIWIGVLVLVAVITGGWFVCRMIGKQVRLNKLKNDFINTVSHELKTPLTSMCILVETLLEGRYYNEQQAKKYLQMVAKENKRLSRLIENFLTFSRMRRNKHAFTIKPISVNDVINDVIDAGGPRFSTDKCSLDVRVAEDVGNVLADPDALITVLVNLLDNAYKYSYDEKKILLDVSNLNGTICFKVSDNGKGMPRRVTKKIFEQFYQADQTLTRAHEGCGLGLSIVKFIVDAHNGTISVDSKPEKGSTFTVLIPSGA
jgi:signal transduction histidine kinase